MFWEIMGEVLKKEFFEGIYKKIVPLVEGGIYDGADPIINKELAVAIQRLSPTIYRNLAKRGLAITVLKNQFYSFLPEVDALIRGVVEGKKPKRKIPTGRFVEQEAKDEKGLIEGIIKDWEEEADRKRPPKNPRYVKERTWPTPELKEIVPGLILEIENIEFGLKEILEVINPPLSHPEPLLEGELFIRARSLPKGLEGNRSLGDMGIVPYGSGMWNNWIRPTRWYPKEKSKI